MTRSIESPLPAAGGHPQPSVQLHIEELVLHGFNPTDQLQIEHGVQLELTRLLAERGLSASLASGSDIDSLDAGSFHLRAGGRAEAAGRQIAHSVFAATAAVMTIASSPAIGSAPLGDARQ